MRFKLDENLPMSATEPLRQLGHDVDTVHDEALSGAADPQVIAAATADARTLITMDKGLADVRIYPPENYAGIILLRPNATGRGEVLQFIENQFPQLPEMELAGRLLVISEAGFRIR
jgi:predicted nuclease of predicted toxin-antitoxin system